MAPVQAGVAVLMSSKSGFIGTAQEMMALYNATNKGIASRYANNTLIQSLLASESMNEYKEIMQKVSSYVSDRNAAPRIKGEVMQTCHDAAQILMQKSNPQEASEYKQWIMDVCNQVANAASEGGQKVSAIEEATIREIVGTFA